MLADAIHEVLGDRKSPRQALDDAAVAATERDIRSRDVAFAPAYITTKHYDRIFSEDSGVPVAESMFNSLVVAVSTSVLTMAIAVPAAAE